MERLKKPPLGLVPRLIRDEQRLNEIDKAIQRYQKAKMDIPTEWIEERDELVTRIYSRENLEIRK